MESEPNDVPTNLKQKPDNCEECKLNPSKYKCPGCSIRSCSLPCVKAHKQRTGCTGKRQMTHFVPLSQFSDNLLLSDYNMLEEVKRVADVAQRRRIKLCGYSQFRLPLALKSLRNAASNRRTKLLFHSRGMLKRERNQSFYNHRKKFISWTIEWKFHSTDILLIDNGVHENSTLCTVIEKHLQPGPWNHPLRQFCKEPLDSLKFFIRKYPKGARSPFHELDIKAPIREQLANVVILEYPVIHVFLPSHSYDFEVIKALTCKPKPRESISNNYQIPEGVTFKEEEIEENNCLDPRILDLHQYANSGDVLPEGCQKQGTITELKNFLDEPLLSREAQDDKQLLDFDTYAFKAEDDNVDSVSKGKELEALSFSDFDFEQGLIDAYSDLIAHTNPDDFLDLEGLLNDEMGLEEGGDHAGFNREFPMEGELEEGEIPGC